MVHNTNKQWTAKQIAQHKTAADLLCKIMEQTFDFIRQNQNVTEYEVHQYIKSQYKQYDMVEDVDPPIVAFRESTANVHYFPQKDTALALADDTLIMIDIWARVNEPDAPFADITWMAWHGGKVPTEIQKGFDCILKSRDIGLDYIQECLDKKIAVSTKGLSDVMTDIVLNSGMQDFVPHGFGHSLGTTGCHGELDAITPKGTKSIVANVSYTIEPGIYVDGQYGFRSEIDFMIDDDGKLDIITTVQDDLVQV